MINIDDILKEFPLISLNKGEDLLKQGGKINNLYFLHKGSVAIIRDGYKVDVASEHGSVFGEVSLMLGNTHSTTIRCEEDCKFYYIDNPVQCVGTHPKVIWYIAQTLSMRLNRLNKLFIEEKIRHNKPEKSKREDSEITDYRQIMAEETLNLLKVNNE